MRKAEGSRWDEASPTAPDRSVRTLAVAALAALALSACQEPAGVGLGLIDEDQSDPQVQTVPLVEIDTLTFGAPAIGIADANNTRPQGRVLVGDVQDAVFGDARALGYVDAIQPGGDLPDADDVRQVWLEMPRVYAYGDTTTALPVTLSQIQGSWEASASYPTDTTFAVGPVLATATVTSAVADTLVRFDLPASWVRANAATLVGDGFQDDFEGFALRTADGFAPAPGAVYGLGTFGSQGAGIRLTTDEDTLFYSLSEVFTSIATQPPTDAPASVLPVRRNSGAELRFGADLSAFGAVPLARGILRLPIDESLAQVGSFVRPISTRSVLYGVRGADEETPSFVSLGTITVTDGQAVLTDTRPLTTALQQSILNPDRLRFDRFEIVPRL